MAIYFIISVMNRYLFNTADYLGMPIATTLLYLSVMTPHIHHKMATYYSVVSVMNRYLFNAATYLGIPIMTG